MEIDFTLSKPWAKAEREEFELPDMYDSPDNLKEELRNMDKITDVSIGNEWEDDSEQCFNYGIQLENGDWIAFRLWWVDSSRIGDFKYAHKLEEAFDNVKEYIVSRLDDE